MFIVRLDLVILNLKYIIDILDRMIRNMFLMN